MAVPFLFATLQMTTIPTHVTAPVKPAPKPVPLLHEPVNTYLMLHTKKVDEVSKGGIYIPEQARDNPHEGQVVKLGPLVHGSYAIDDTVVYTQHSAYKLRIDGIDYTLVEEANIILRIPAAANASTTAPVST